MTEPDFSGKLNLPKGRRQEEGTIDRYTLSMHLYHKHNIENHEGFQNAYEFTILEKCSPKDLDVKEHLWVQKLKSLFPLRLNLYSPLGFPLLT